MDIIGQIIQMEASASKLSIEEVVKSFRYIEKNATWVSSQLVDHELPSVAQQYFPYDDGPLTSGASWCQSRVEAAITRGHQYRHSSKSMAYLRTYLLNVYKEQARQYVPFLEWIARTERRTSQKPNLLAVIQMSKYLVARKAEQHGFLMSVGFSERYSEHWEHIGSLRVDTSDWLKKALNDKSTGVASNPVSLPGKNEEVKWEWTGPGYSEVSLIRRDGIIYVNPVTAWEYTTNCAMLKCANFFKDHDDILELFKNVMIHGTNMARAAAFVASYLDENDSIYFLIAGLAIACEDSRVEKMLKDLAPKVGLSITDTHESEAVKPWISLNLKKTFALEKVEKLPKLCDIALGLFQELEDSVVNKSGFGQRPPSKLFSQV